MLLVVIAIACIISVPLSGGRLSRLGELEVHATWAVLVSAAIQVVITSAVRGGDYALHVSLHVISYALVGWFVFTNRRLIGMPFVALGAGLNVLAISVNGGVMPAATAALRIAGIDTSGGFSNSAQVEHPRLLFLGDVIPIPGPWPIGNVLSVGDLLIVTGALILLHGTCASRLTRAFRMRSRPGRRPLQESS
jgi:Family of unknown function (DUF5317)